MDLREHLIKIERDTWLRMAQLVKEETTNSTNFRLKGQSWPSQKPSPFAISRNYIFFLTVFNSYKLIRIFLPKFIIFLSVTHQRKNNFLDDCLLEGNSSFNHMLHMITKYIFWLFTWMAGSKIEHRNLEIHVCFEPSISRKYKQITVLDVVASTNGNNM